MKKSKIDEEKVNMISEEAARLKKDNPTLSYKEARALAKNRYDSLIKEESKGKKKNEKL